MAGMPEAILPGRGTSVEFDVVRLVLAGLIALVGYAVARGSGANRGRSIVYAASILVIAAVVAVVKNVLAGH
jgi:VIT1/CCC1 family predicted Fe2+/Mn2+ transporter